MSARTRFAIYRTLRRLTGISLAYRLTFARGTVA